MAKLPHKPAILKNPDRGDPLWYFYQLPVNTRSTKIILQFVICGEKGLVAMHNVSHSTHKIGPSGVNLMYI